MREIKFRAWDLKRMTTSGIMFNTSTGQLVVPDGSRMVLMQFTGLLDKNGKEIYEGDIVKQFGNIKPMVVEWFRLAFRFQRIFHLCEFDSQSLEIIGNIYENPELLKQKK